MKPTKDYIKVKPEERENKTKSGFILTDMEKFPIGKVEEVGDGVKRVTPGLTIAYREYSAIEIDDFVYLREEDVIAYKEEK